MKKNLIKKIKSFKQKNIAVIGDLMLDRTEWGKISNKVNPENSKVPIINVYDEKFYLGGAGNVARNVAALGSNTILYGVLGKDFYSQRLKELLKESKINYENLIEVNHPTIVKARIFIDGKYEHRSDLGEDKLEKISLEIQENILKKLKAKIHDLDGIILSDYNKHLFTKNLTQEIINLSKKEGVYLFADFKPKNAESFKSSYLISPNKKEAEEITGIKYDGTKKTLEKMGKTLSKKMNSKKTIITLGEEGAYYYSERDNLLIPTNAKKVVEVTGAGDSFISTLTTARSSGFSIKDSVKLANYSAGIVVEKQGTSTTSIEELIKCIEEEKAL